jgi:molybdate ABC transporter permease protein
VDEGGGPQCGSPRFSVINSRMDFDPVWISIKTALTATAITFVLGVAAARWMLAYRGKARGLIDGLLLLPLVLPPTVVGFILLLIFGKNGPVGQLLLRWGATVIFSWPAAVITATVVAFPLMYRTTLAAFEQLDENVIQAARTLGASEFELLGRVMLPLAWPGVMAATALAFARALGEFGATLMLAGDIPGQTQTLPLAIFFAVEGGDLVKAGVWTLIVVAISLVVVVAIHYWSRAARAQGSGFGRAEDGVSSLSPEESLDSLLLHNWSATKEPKASHPDPVMSRNSSVANSQSSGSTVVLCANFQKRLPGFTLEVDFATGTAPVGLIGPSGSGKTMTLRAIAGLEKPTRGRIVLNGQVLFDSEAHINLPTRKRQVGFVFQNYALFPNLTAAQNIAFGIRGASKQERAQRVAELVHLFQLRGLEDRFPHQLSGGQQQRVAVARALAIRPQAIFLDEPLSALDTYLRSLVEMQLIEALKDYQGATLYVTHNMEEAYRISTSLIVLAGGKQVACGAKEEIFRRPAVYSVARVTGCKNFSRVRPISSGFVEATDWNCTLRVAQPVPAHPTCIGIRAHHVEFANTLAGGREPRVAGRLAAAYTGAAAPARGRAISGTKAPDPAEIPSRVPADDEENTFPCWLTKTSETPFRVTLYLRLREPAAHEGEYHLQAEVFKEKWLLLKDRPFPWRVRLDPERLFLMRE